MRANRIVFANELRGVAALSVATIHLIGVYWVMREAVSAATFTPPQPGPLHPWAAALSATWFNPGSFGVGLFFLISGLVIPISLDGHSRASFLAARLLRIYPVYIVAGLLDVAVLLANAHFWNVPFTLSTASILSNLLLIQDFTGHWSLDLVNWSLCIELRFYLLMALCAPLIRRGNLSVLFGIAAMAYAANLLTHSGMLGPSVPDPSLIAYTVSTESLFLVFMLIGVVFNYHLRGLLRAPAAIVAGLGLLGVFMLTWRQSVLAGQWPGITENYLAALALFAALYAARNYVPSLRPLEWLAAISYPLYVVHPLVGYSVIRLLMLHWHLSYGKSLLGAVIVVLLFATALHFTVERATIRIGQRLRRRVSRPVLAPVAAE